MKDIPIMFSAPMILALLSGSKTMTRRLRWTKAERLSQWNFVKPGDKLWVRENLTCTGNGIWRWAADQAHVRALKKDEAAVVAFQNKESRGNVPSIYMPRFASRLTLIVTATKIERLQSLTAEDAVAEGIGVDVFPKASISLFKGLWDSLHGIGAWNENPEVVCLSFRVVKQNIDALPKSEAA